MSGIAGIFHRDGTAVNVDHLLSMIDSLAYRGPDGSGLWAEREIGLGHTLLNTSTSKSEAPTHQNEPIHMKSQWITADAHLDSKAELITQLQATGRIIEGNACDASVILHAYGAWGPECVEHLRGDFSFAIWDSTAKTLFCARDHFGIKPFYYAETGKAFIFSNTLNCLLRYSGVTTQLNEEAIGDFLLFGWNYNERTTTFRDIQRLPAAHSLLVSADNSQMKRYWYPATQERIRYSRHEDYIQNFMELFQAAVVDRLPPDRAAILLSGGLDSGAVAAVASSYSKRMGWSPALRSFTVGYDHLVPDREGFYAQQTARHLGIPNEFLALDNLELFEGWDDVSYRCPEPSADPFYVKKITLYRQIALHSRVALSGEGADNLLYFQMWPYIKDLRRRREWSRLVFEISWFLWVRPLPWLGAARRIQRLIGKRGEGLRVPAWIAPDFAKRARLKERSKEIMHFVLSGDRHEVRPKAHASMLNPQWTGFFESDDPGATRCPVEVRYPFLDLRIVSYLLAIPAFPWAYKKKLLRDSMFNRLPEKLRLRPKTPVLVDPVMAKLRQKEIKFLNVHEPLTSQAFEYINATKLNTSNHRIDPEEIRAYCLDKWLRVSVSAEQFDFGGID